MTDFEEFKRTCDEKHIADRERISKLEDTITRIFEILQQIQDRPSWFVVLIISGLGTSCGAMLMYIITHGK